MSNIYALLDESGNIKTYPITRQHAHASGIPLEFQSRVFQPFFSTKAAGEGIGLGLDLCSKIIAEHEQLAALAKERGIDAGNLIDDGIPF